MGGAGTIAGAVAGCGLAVLVLAGIALWRIQRNGWTLPAARSFGPKLKVPPPRSDSLNHDEVEAADGTRTASVVPLPPAARFQAWGPTAGGFSAVPSTASTVASTATSRQPLAPLPPLPTSPPVSQTPPPSHPPTFPPPEAPPRYSQSEAAYERTTLALPRPTRPPLAKLSVHPSSLRGTVSNSISLVNVSRANQSLATLSLGSCSSPQSDPRRWSHRSMPDTGRSVFDAGDGDGDGDRDGDGVYAGDSGDEDEGDGSPFLRGPPMMDDIAIPTLSKLAPSSPSAQIFQSISRESAADASPPRSATSSRHGGGAPTSWKKGRPKSLRSLKSTKSARSGRTDRGA